MVNHKPVKRSISFERSAQKLSKRTFIDLNKSNPPKKTINPTSTTMCMNNFFFDGTFIAKREKTRIAKPKKEGMNDVNELLLLKREITTPQVIKKVP
tara:strand:- start:344 stop:634 length:291 start_codon:yes stop_codon:yes gene_type:complete